MERRKASTPACWPLTQSGSAIQAHGAQVPPAKQPIRPHERLPSVRDSDPTTTRGAPASGTAALPGPRLCRKERCLALPAIARAQQAWHYSPNGPGAGEPKSIHTSRVHTGTVRLLRQYTSSGRRGANEGHAFVAAFQVCRYVHSSKARKTAV
jgi:hypothetical protein